MTKYPLSGEEVHNQYWQRGLLQWGVLLVSLYQASGRPSLAAERIYVRYSIFGRSVPVQALETYVRDGKLSPELVSYARFIKPQQMAHLREGLQQKVDFSAIALSQFLYSPTGEILLERGSRFIQTPLGHGSFYALRSALISAAEDPEGLTPLSMFRHYPNPDIVVNLEEVVGMVHEVNRLFKQTAMVTQSIEASSTGLVLPVSDQTRLLQLEQPGPFSWQKITLDLQDNSEKRLRYTRNVRKLPVDIYLPNSDQPQPVVLISHGLNSDRQSYAYLATHLASYGYGVVVPEHPGSSKQQIKSLLGGFGHEVTAPTEFLDRPLDIEFLLDVLQKLSRDDPRFKDKLNLQQVGIIGQSFGGYTALASAGASFNFKQLRQSCSTQLDKTLNVSLVLQCQALRLSPANYQLSEPRIKAAIAINPFTSAVFGPAGLAQIQVPVMVISGSSDIIAPALLEQIQPFTALTTVQRYLVLIQNGTHFSTIATSPGEDPSVPTLQGAEGPAPGLAQTYTKALSLIFMQVYLRNQVADQVYLSPAGAAALSRAPLPLSLVNSLSVKALEPEGSTP